MDCRWGSSVPWTIYTGKEKKALQITLDGYTYKPMSVTSETDTQTQRTWENTPVLYAVLISLVSLSPSLSVPLTEHAGVIRLESDSKWHFTHARPCRLITQPQGCIFLVCVTPLPHTSTYTHISSSITHRNTQTYVTNLKSLILTGATTVPVHLQPVLLRDIGHIASTVKCTRWERVSLKHLWKGLDFFSILLFTAVADKEYRSICKNNTKLCLESLPLLDERGTICLTVRQMC